MAPRLPSITRTERIDIIEKAISSGRLSPPGPRAAAPSQLSAGQLQRYSDFLRRNPTETDLTYQDLRGHGRTPEKPGRLVHLTKRGVRRDQWKAGSRRGQHATKAGVARATSHMTSDEVVVAIHGKFAYEKTDPKQTGWRSIVVPRADLESALQSSLSLEEIADELFDAQGMWSETYEWSVSDLNE